VPKGKAPFFKGFSGVEEKAVLGMRGKFGTILCGKHEERTEEGETFLLEGKQGKGGLWK